MYSSDELADNELASIQRHPEKNLIVITHHTSDIYKYHSVGENTVASHHTYELQNAFPSR